ncbi:MAG: UTP--glucose-1-phosphate uridylyltransferase [Deltaproteobacteria bacterium]|nr:UTP--glucose-1-phosphate uridylyltransferase [Deltaproteobacteria bacterium]
MEQPNLVAAIEALPAPALGKLIDHVGLEDAGEIVALATTEQIRRILDDDLWRSEGPGQDESFAADRFALWLEIMLSPPCVSSRRRRCFWLDAAALKDDRVHGQRQRNSCTMDDLDETTRAVLARFRFDAALSDRLRARLAASGGESFTGQRTGEVALPLPGDLKELPALDSSEGRELAALGQAALAGGQAGVVILAGGMATRFGGVVKAVVDVVPGHSFLRLKLADVERAAAASGGEVSVFLLGSHATSDVLRQAVGGLAPPGVRIEVLEQSVTLRLGATGELFREQSGQVSLCATGHGDVLPTLRTSGALARFRRAGGRMLLVSNVDNLAATLDPRVLGAHMRSGKAVTVENVRKVPGDRGGIPARVDGHLQIVEEFRLPAGFDGASVPFFNTNTFVLDAEAIDRDFDLDWFLVRRKVEGREAIQPERLLGQVTAFLPTQFLVVPRTGREGRFLPVKDREELQMRMPEIRNLLAALGISA